MMRAISLWQPWASLMAVGVKKNETRGRGTNIRGEVAICAAKKLVDVPPALRVVLAYHGLVDNLPLGCVVGVCEIEDCKPVVDIPIPGAMEYVCGDYSDGRFAWITKNMRRLPEPVPVRGAQGFFFLPADVEAKVMAQLAVPRDISQYYLRTE